MSKRRRANSSDRPIATTTAAVAKRQRTLSPLNALVDPTAWDGFRDMAATQIFGPKGLGSMLNILLDYTRIALTLTCKAAQVEPAVTIYMAGQWHRIRRRYQVMLRWISIGIPSRAPFTEDERPPSPARVRAVYRVEEKATRKDDISWIHKRSGAVVVDTTYRGSVLYRTLRWRVTGKMCLPPDLRWVRGRSVTEDELIAVMLEFAGAADDVEFLATCGIEWTDVQWNYMVRRALRNSLPGIDPLPEIYKRRYAEVHKMDGDGITRGDICNYLVRAGHAREALLHWKEKVWPVTFQSIGQLLRVASDTPVFDDDAAREELAQCVIEGKPELVSRTLLNYYGGRGWADIFYSRPYQDDFLLGASRYLDGKLRAVDEMDLRHAIDVICGHPGFERIRPHHTPFWNSAGLWCTLGHVPDYLHRLVDLPVEAPLPEMRTVVMEVLYRDHMTLFWILWERYHAQFSPDTSTDRQLHYLLVGALLHTPCPERIVRLLESMEATHVWAPSYRIKDRLAGAIAAVGTKQATRVYEHVASRFHFDAHDTERVVERAIQCGNALLVNIMCKHGRLRLDTVRQLIHDAEYQVDPAFIKAIDWALPQEKAMTATDHIH